MSAKKFIMFDTLGELITSRYVISFGIAWLGVITVVLLALWGMGGFIGLDRTGDIALVLGIIFTSGLGAALMALLFYSDRSNADEDAYHAAEAASRQTRREVRATHWRVGKPSPLQQHCWCAYRTQSRRQEGRAESRPWRAGALAGE
jgi:hypothetical protein